MKKILLVGSDISESPSPKMQNTALAYMKLSEKIVYELHSIAPEHFEKEIVGIKSDADVIGLNVTKPFKEAVIKHLDKSDRFTQICGSCNVIKVENGLWTGFNTDGYGYVMPLVRRDITLTDSSLLIFGAGGAARACILQSINNSIKKICVVNRNLDNAEKVKRDILSKTKFDPANFIVLGYNDLQNSKISCIIKESKVIVNATPAFQGGGDLPFIFEPPMFSADSVIFDLSYYENPKSSLLEGARAAGCRIIRGLEMLMYQGHMSFFHWTAKKPPIFVMTRALDLRLG